jgi:phage terminase large subunit
MSDFVFPYQPRKQLLPFHNRSQRWALMVCHRRFGKTVGCVGELILRALYTKKKNAEFAYVGPLRQQAKKIAWSYLKEFTEGLRKGPPRESDLCVTLLNGAKITIYGADNPDSIRGLFFDGVVIDEFGDCRPSLWKEVIYPTLMDRGGWAVFIGTPKGKNHFYKMLERSKRESDWFSYIMKASESGIFTLKELEDAKREMGEDAYEREMECSFDASVPGTYYTNIIADLESTTENFGSYPYNPDLKVNIAADLGYSDSTALWFWQVDANGPIMIDYEEHTGQKLEFYFDLIDHKGYDYDTIWLPHDATAKTLQTGRSTIEQFADRYRPKKIKLKPVPRLARQHGIDAARMMLPKTRFNIETCYAGVEALRAYRRQYNEKTQSYADVPLHDWSSNGSDSYRYFSLVTDSVYEAEEIKAAGPGDDAMTLDNLWAAREEEASANRYRTLRI